jgi:hypothetical protein
MSTSVNVLVLTTESRVFLDFETLYLVLASELFCVLWVRAQSPRLEDKVEGFESIQLIQTHWWVE